jgi:hypothetical protein
MALQLLGADGVTLLSFDAASKAARATLYDNAGNAAIQNDAAQPSVIAGVPMLGLSDKQLFAARFDRWGSQTVALHTPLFYESFEGGSLHPLRWTTTLNAMSATQSSAGGMVFNSGATTVVNVGFMLQSAKRFMKTQRSPMQAKFRARLNRVNNSVMELGFGDAATFNGANTAGAYWQVTASGVMQPVVTFNSVDQTGANISASINTANYYTFDVMFDDDKAIFVAQDTSTGQIISRQSITLPQSGVRLLSATQLPVIVRLYNSGTAPVTAPQLILSDVHVLALDADQNKPWPHALAAMDRGMPGNPFTGA